LSSGHWVKELPAEIMVCDSGGIILEMNDQAKALFAEDGGRGLLGKNVLACHPQPALGKLERLLDKRTANSYFNTENGEKRFFFQSPWFKDGAYAGFVEISFGVPEQIPHFTRE
jgi:hypothetical protein